MSHIIETLHVEIQQLAKSPRNVRMEERTGIAELAQQIDCLGLMHPPTVVRVQTGKGKKARTVYEVDAGERRRLALFWLVEQGRRAPGDLIEVRRIEPASGVAMSLAENIGREPMHPADEFAAFRRLIDEGRSVDDVAAHFGVSELVVRRRLRLASVSSVLIKLYRKGELNLDQMMALAVTDDHKMQERVWASAPPWERDAASIRAPLTQAEVHVGRDPLARFVGIEAYERAGGGVRRDLFADDGDSYMTDRGLLESLAAAKLGTVVEEVRAEGWAWVAVVLRSSHETLYRFAHCAKVRREPTPDEQAVLDAAAAEVEQLQADLDELEGGEEADFDQDRAEALEQRLAAGSAKLDALRAALVRWDDDMMAHAGAVVTIERTAGDSVPAVQVHRGLVRPEDRKAANEAARAAGVSFAGGAQATAPRPRPEHSEALMRRLSAHRTIALQAVVAKSTHVSLVLLGGALAARGR